MSFDSASKAGAVERWFDNARSVAFMLNELDSAIANCFIDDAIRDGLLADKLIPGSVLSWMRDEFNKLPIRVSEKLSRVGELINELRLAKEQWLGEYLLLSFPSLGYFELQDARWKFAWDRLLVADSIVRDFWAQIEARISEQNRDYLPEDFFRVVANCCRKSTTESTETIYALSDADYRKIDERLLLEMAQVLREILKHQNYQTDGCNVNEMPANGSKEIECLDHAQYGLDRETRSFRWLGELYQNLPSDAMDAIEKIESNHRNGRPTTKDSILKNSGQTSIGKLFRRGDAKRLREILIDSGGSVDLPRM